MAKMYLMCGHPGSGKTYYAKRFAECNDYRYLSIDDTYAYFNGDPTSHENKFLVWMTFYQQIHAAEVAGHNIVVDTNAPTPNDRMEFLNWFPSFDHHLIWIDASRDLCIKNNKDRKRHIPSEDMENIFNLFRAPSINEINEDYPCRAKWKSIIKIRNINNHFEWPEVLYHEGNSFFYKVLCPDEETSKRAREYFEHINKTLKSCVDSSGKVYIYSDKIDFDGIKEVLDNKEYSAFINQDGGRCMGTKEIDLCGCKGKKINCTFY